MVRTIDKNRISAFMKMYRLYEAVCTRPIQAECNNNVYINSDTGFSDFHY